jgi:hypothetical protein
MIIETVDRYRRQNSSARSDRWKRRTANGVEDNHRQARVLVKAAAVVPRRIRQRDELARRCRGVGRAAADPRSQTQPGSRLTRLLPDGTAAQFRNDVEVTEVPGVLLDEVDENPLESGRCGAVPASSWSTDAGQVVSLDDGPATVGLGLECSDETFGGLFRFDVPPVGSSIAPRILDLTALEAPLEPAQLDEGEVLDQFPRGPT